MVLNDLISVEIVYALPREQVLRTLHLRAGTTVGAAIELSGLGSIYKTIDAGNLTFGIFGNRVAVDSVLRNGDRIEIYRPLTADPKEVRRRRARTVK